MIIGGSKMGVRFTRGFEAVEEHEGIAAALEICRLIASRQWLSLMLYGPTGRGKTTLLTATVIECDRKFPGDRYAYWVVPELVLRRREVMEQQELLFDYFDVYVLALDDLGAEMESDWWQEGLQAVIDYRWRMAYPTMIATNLTPTQIQQRYGDRLLRRFLPPYGEIIELKGPNWSVVQAKTAGRAQPTVVAPSLPSDEESGKEEEVPIPPEVAERLRKLLGGGGGLANWAQEVDEAKEEENGGEAA